ncbi:MAG: amidase domain-containing protein [Thermaerobacter sp.]|nr:amidase domain-containing protein [Thermaerobacter sp.]
MFTAGQAFAYSYNGGAAATYADTYWSNYNSNYPSFIDDCTNFVSQSLYAGGLPQYVYYNLHTGVPETTSNNAYWFMDSGNVNYAYSWTVAADLYAHLTQYGYGTLYATHPGTDTVLMTGMVKGDVLFYNWGEAGNPSGTAGINHATIQTGYGTTSDSYTNANYVDSHTNNRYHVLWSLYTYNTHRASTTIYLVHIP